MEYTDVWYVPYHGSACFRSAWNNWSLARFTSEK
jgi:hypothetical protein